MIICFEGPDFAGKSTTIEKLITNSKFVSDLNQMGIKEIQSFHFPNTNGLPSGYHVWNCINNEKSLQEDNPYYQIMAFFTDFYSTMYSLAKNNLYKYINNKENLVILDRYYYSSLIMCPFWQSTDNYIKNKLNLRGDRKMTKEIANEIIALKNDIQNYAISSVSKMKLPAPDLNIVLLPVYDLIETRSKKRAATDINETEIKIKENYTAYRNAVSLDMMKIFGSNGEPLPPVILRSSNITIPTFDNDITLAKFSRLINYQEYFDASKIARQCGNVITKFIGLETENEAIKEDHSKDLLDKIVEECENETNNEVYVGKGKRVKENENRRRTNKRRSR